MIWLLIAGVEFTLAGTLWQYLVFHRRATKTAPALDEKIFFAEFRRREILQRKGWKMNPEQWEIFRAYKFDEIGWALLIVASAIGAFVILILNRSNVSVRYVTAALTVLQLFAAKFFMSYWRRKSKQFRTPPPRP